MHQPRCGYCENWVPFAFTATSPTWGQCTKDGRASKWTAGHPFCGFERGQCTVCSAPSTAFGVFMPNDPQAYGAPMGKVRTFGYRVCDRCATDPDTCDRVEKIIEHGFLGNGSQKEGLS